eukprot:1628227-Rhodomonas_salina.3
MLDARCVEEYIDVRAGYSIDVFLPEHNLAVEVDGPFHFARGEKVQLGNAVMKHRCSRLPQHAYVSRGVVLTSRVVHARHLRQLGYSLISVPYWEWSDQTSPQDKVRYLMSLVAPHIRTKLPPPEEIVEANHHSSSSMTSVSSADVCALAVRYAILTPKTVGHQEDSDLEEEWTTKEMILGQAAEKEMLMTNSPNTRGLDMGWDWPELDFGLLEVDPAVGAPE